MGRWTRGSKKKPALRNLILPRPASHENTPTIIYNPEATDLSQVMSYLSPSLTRSSTRCPRFFNFLDFYNTSPISLFHVFPFFFFVFFFFSFFPFFFLFFFFFIFRNDAVKKFTGVFTLVRAFSIPCVQFSQFLGNLLEPGFCLIYTRIYLLRDCPLRFDKILDSYKVGLSL